MWKSSLELDHELTETPEVSKLGAIYSLSLFWRNCIYASGYTAAGVWESNFALTPHGETTLRGLTPRLGDVPQADLRQAFFARFFHHDLFVDHQNTDTSKIQKLLEEELAQERIRLPHRYGRLLYDRFNDIYTDTRTDHLMNPDVERLLQGTPVGVSQVGRFVSGPLGIIESQESRFLPPTLKLPLWHCSDTGCNAIHYVGIREPSVPVVDAFSRIKNALVTESGSASEWVETLAAYLHGPTPRHYVDLPAFIADCIVGTDRSVLLETALNGSRGKDLRGILSVQPRSKRDASGPARAVARNTQPEAQLQLLLALSDTEIVGLIDDAVLSRAIKIPLGETREVIYSTPRHTRDLSSELSALGIRSAKQAPAVNLTSAIWRAYQLLGLSSELEWRVRGDGAKSLYEALASFVRSRGPADSVRELILSSAKVTGAVCENLHIPLKYASGTDSATVDRLLWKLGFNPMQFEEPIPRFKARLGDFREVVLSTTPIETEDARERIRAAGVNVFVSLEEFLDRLIGFNLWLLSADHFLVTSFEYSSSEARKAVLQTLGPSLRSGDVTVAWNVNGENALGTLVRYLRETAEWVKSLPGRSRDELLRPDRDLPHFADDKDLRFPFRHTALWADSDRAELQRYADILASIVKLVEESEPSAVRNGLDHFREADRFPPPDKLLGCVVRLSQALELADVHRFLPKVFWLFGRKGNRYGSAEYEFRDYAGRQVVAYGPALVSGIYNFSYDYAYILAPGNLLGMPNSSLAFEVKESSEYSSYWENYPRRRHIGPGNGRASSTQQNGLQSLPARAATSDANSSADKQSPIDNDSNEAPVKQADASAP